MPPLTVVQREINSHSSPPLSHRKPTIMEVVVAAAADRTMRIQFRRGRDGKGWAEGKGGRTHMKSATDYKFMLTTN